MSSDLAFYRGELLFKKIQALSLFDVEYPKWFALTIFGYTGIDSKCLDTMLSESLLGGNDYGRIYYVSDNRSELDMKIMKVPMCSFIIFEFAHAPMYVLTVQDTIMMKRNQFNCLDENYKQQLIEEFSVPTCEYILHSLVSSYEYNDLIPTDRQGVLELPLAMVLYEHPKYNQLGMCEYIRVQHRVACEKEFEIAANVSEPRHFVPKVEKKQALVQQPVAEKEKPQYKNKKDLAKAMGRKQAHMVDKVWKSLQKRQNKEKE